MYVAFGVGVRISGDGDEKIIGEFIDSGEDVYTREFVEL